MAATKPKPKEKPKPKNGGGGKPPGTKGTIGTRS